MQKWNLAMGDHLRLTLAADARLALTNYTDDQVWELSMGGGEPAALALQTTYGLRAHWMRLFPRFVLNDLQRTDPGSFSTPPHILRLYPNALTITFEPFEGVEVIADYWIPESQVASGRITLTNRSILPLNLRLEWVALLNPIDRQGGMLVTPVGPSHVLAGETSSLHPVVFMTGKPQPSKSSYPALEFDLELYPGNSYQVFWSTAAMSSFETSLENARLTTTRSWDAENARINLLNQSQTIQVHTGDPDWDSAFALTQKTAFTLLFNNPAFMQCPSFVLSRRPDQGFSVRGDGSDYPYLWSGQTALDSYYLASLLLPGAPDLVAGLLRNFLEVQEENGAIDWKPGLGGQLSHRLAQPLLATLAVQVAPYMVQPDWYQEVFPGLLRFFNTWFDPAIDQDGDGLPEWEHPLQTGLEDSPIFDRWSPNAQGIDINRLEAPGLAAMLLRECQSLIEMATLLKDDERVDVAYDRLSGDGASQLSASGVLPVLHQREDDLRAVINSTWDGKAKTYRYRDYQTHLSQPGQLLHEFMGSGQTISRKRFNQPHRLVFQLRATEERTYTVVFNIHGSTIDGETCETLTARNFSWQGHHARATTQNTFLALKRIEALGVGDEDLVRIMSADYTLEDFSLLLPLWAGAPSSEQARQIIEENLQNRYLLDYGNSLCPLGALIQEELPGLHTGLTSALLPWNHLIGEGLLRYGYQEKAAGLVTRLMNAVIDSLKAHRDFHQYYHAETGLAAGEPGHLHGLAPLGLFLQTLGVRQFSEKEILLDGFNPFPWTINVQYRKILITFYSDKTEIQFTGGQKVIIDHPGLHRVILA
jgi:hypothetical protein